MFPRLYVSGRFDAQELRATYAARCALFALMLTLALSLGINPASAFAEEGEALAVEEVEQTQEAIPVEEATGLYLDETFEATGGDEASVQEDAHAAANLSYEATYNNNGTCTLTKITIPDGATSPATLTVPSTITYNGKSYTVTDINANSATGLTSGDFRNTTSLVLPKTLTKISGGYFKLNSVREIIIPGSVKTFSGSFQSCVALENLVFEEGVETIKGNNALIPYCSNITSIKLPNSLKTLKANFSNATGLQSISWPDTLDVSSADNLFKGCTALKEVTLPSATTEIPYFGFQGCTALTKVVAKSPIEYVWTSAFGGCTALTEIPDLSKVTYMGGYAFQNCSALTASVDLSSLKTVPQYAFYGSHVTIAKLSDNLEKVDSFGLSGVTFAPTSDGAFTFPSTFRYPERFAFYQSEFPAKIVLSDRVKVIGKSAFDEIKNVQEIYVGSGVTSVPSGVFANISTLKKIYVYNTEDQVSKKENWPSGVEVIYLGTGKTVKATKAWKLDDGRTAATSVKVQLKLNGKAYGNAVELNEANSWSYTWNHMVESGTWSVEELEVPAGFTSSVKKAEDGDEITFTVTNDDKPKANWKRLAGANRLDTMAAISAEGWSKSDSVVIAVQANYADALSANALAGALQCPVLLTEGTKLSSQTLSEVKRLGATKVYLVGGEKVILPSVANELKAVGCTVERVAGATRQETATRVAQKAAQIKGSKTCIVAYGVKFPDALAISPYSYATSSPIFLTEGDGSLSSNTLANIKALGFSHAVIVGGTGAVSGSVEGQLASAGVSRVERKAGNNRYETASAVAQWCVDQGMTVKNMAVAYGENFPDAIAGAALCGKNNAVLVLASDADHSCIEGFVVNHKDDIRNGYVYGGESAVTAATWDVLVKLTE